MNAGSPAVTQSVVVPLKMRESAITSKLTGKKGVQEQAPPGQRPGGVHLHVVCGEQSGVTVPHHAKRPSRQGASNDDRQGPGIPGSG